MGNYAFDTFRRLQIDQKMISILVVFTILGILLTISMVIATNTLSGLRGYSSFQVNWTEARIDATYHLLDYIESEENQHLVHFKNSLLLIDRSVLIRNEFNNDDIDYQFLRTLFLQTHTSPEDIDNMIVTFEWFHSFGDFQFAIQEWVESDKIITQMKELAMETKQLINTNSFSDQKKTEFMEKVLSFDDLLTTSKFQLASALSSGNRLLSSIMLWIAISLGSILLLTGGLLSFRFLISLKKWERKIEKNEQKINDQLEEKTHLISEIHDRVKNNLALISSLIQLQQNVTKEPEVSSSFEGTISRIHSMAMVHERLYHNETFSSIRMDEYVTELLETVQKKHSSTSEKVTVFKETQPVTLNIKQSIPTGLLLNELLVNAFKHGANSSNGKIEVSFFQNKDKIYIKVADNGPGLPDDFSLEYSKTLGMTLVSVLMRQLNAKYQLDRNNGTSFSIVFTAQG